MPARASSRAVPKSMSGPQFDRLLTVAGRFSLLAIGCIAVVIALALGRAILAPVCFAIVVGLVFGPLADALERRRVPAALSAAVVVLVFVAILVVGATLFARPLSEWVARGPALWEKLRGQLVELRGPLQSLGDIQDQLRGLMGADTSLTVKVQDGGPVQDVALMAPSVLADALLFLASLYFFLATRHQIRISVLSLCFSRRMRWRTAHIFRDIEAKISRFLLSAAAINAGVGVATAIATYALGLPSPLLWGALAAVMNFVPYVGQAVMIAVLLAVGLGTQSNLVGIVAPALAYAAVNLTADQIIFPHFVGRALTLNPFVILVSIAFWIWIWGPVGGFIAVPSLLVLQSLIMHLFPATQRLPAIVQRKMEERAASAAPSAADGAPDPKPEEAAPRRKSRKAAIPASP